MLKLITANLSIFSGLTTYCLLVSQPAIAQITADGTLSTKVTPDGVNFLIENGTRSGNNLFHSFQEFSVPTNSSAIFKNAKEIENIFSRVTGGNISRIDGLIKANDTANLFLLNPSGVIFGPGAALNIGGSFVTSTADGIRFADGVFSATDTSTPPILSMNVPLGLQLGSNPNATIRVEGDGNNLRLQRDSSLDSSNRPQGLHYQTPNNQTLALVGGNVVLDQGNITLPKGRVELWSVNDGEVSLDNNSGQLKLKPVQGINYGNINLINAASVDISSSSATSIQVRGKNINLKNGSVILAQTQKNGTGGILNIEASESLTVEGFVLNRNNQVFSGILADVAPGGTGKGGNMFINTKNLFITDGGQISAGTFSSGNGGILNVKAEKMEVTGSSLFGPSGLFVPVNANATGKGGNIFIDTNTLKMDGAAQIAANTFGMGDGGNLTIKAQQEVELVGTLVVPNPRNSRGFSEFPTGLVANAERRATGNAGTLTLKTNSLKVRDGAQIIASTFTRGNAGTIRIEANNIELNGISSTGERPSGIFSLVFPGSTGVGGDLQITTQSLKVVDGAAIVTSTGGLGRAGDITINATKSVELIGKSASTEDRSGLFANALIDRGDGGNININTEQLIIKDGAAINVSNFPSSNSATAPGTGKTGNLQIQAKSVLLDSSTPENVSNITASSAAQDGGNISLNLQDSLIARNGSQILAETRGDGKGGDINITSKRVSLTRGAQISANSTGLGQAGNINIRFERLETNAGKITATSEKTGGGNITLTATASEIFLRNNSLVSTSVLDSTGGGGNILISASAIAVLENSSIKANAVSGPGGNIQINTQALFLSPDSTITASSQFGVDGQVTVNSTEEDKKVNTNELPTAPLDTTKLVARSCSQKENSLTVAGKGGLPLNPSQTLRSQDLWVDLRSPGDKLAQKQPKKINNSGNHNSVAAGKKVDSNPSQIREAQGWIINTNGKIELVVNSPQTTSHVSQNMAADCQG